jgi:hypothetical protein
MIASRGIDTVQPITPPAWRYCWQFGFGVPLVTALPSRAGNFKKSRNGGSVRGWGNCQPVRAVPGPSLICSIERQLNSDVPLWMSNTIPSCAKNRGPPLLRRGNKPPVLSCATAPGGRSPMSISRMSWADAQRPSCSVKMRRGPRPISRSARSCCVIHEAAGHCSA